MSKHKILYIIGLIFFTCVFLAITFKNISLFSNNNLGRAVYDNGTAYLIVDNKVVDEPFRVYNQEKAINGSFVTVLYNKEINNDFLYIVNYNLMLKDYFFMIIFISIFIYLIRKDSR